MQTSTDRQLNRKREAKSLLMLSLSLLGLLAACVPNGTSSPPGAALTSVPATTQALASHTPQAIATSTRTPIPTPSQTLAPTNTSAPSPTASPTLFLTRTLGPGGPPYTKDELSQWLVGAYQDGRDVNELRAELLDSGWLGTQSKDYWWWEFLNMEGWDPFQVLDLDGDGEQEWILTVVEIASFCGPFGELWIIGSEGITYILAITEENYEISAPVLIGHADMTGDELPELVIQSVYCTAHTPFDIYHILSAQTGKITNLVQMDTDIEHLVWLPRSLSYGDYNDFWSNAGISISNSDISFSDENADGISDLVIQGGTYNSEGAGDVRERIETWGWDGKSVVLQKLAWVPSQQRFHILYEANAAFILKENEKARDLYQQVIEDETLLNGVGRNIGDEEGNDNYSSARQFAAFRLAMLALKNKDLPEASMWRDWLVTEYPQAAITQAAILLVDEWQGTNDLRRTCERVSAFLETQPNPTGHLVDAGYGNPYLPAESVCPTTDQVFLQPPS